RRLLVAAARRAFLRPVVIRGERVRREHVALGRYYFRSVRALRLVHILEGRTLRRVLGRDLVPGLERSEQNVGRRTEDAHAVLLDHLLDGVGVVLLPLREPGDE